MATILHNAPLIGCYRYEVEPFQEDVTGALAWHIMGNLLLRCANLHAATQGFGYDNMIALQHVWVLSRLSLCLDKMPRTGQAFDICTWVEGYFKHFSDRAYTISDTQGNTLGQARTIWSLIDTQSRQPADLETFAGNLFKDCVTQRAEEMPTVPRFRMSLIQPIRSITAYFSDLDINGHVNSIRYLMHALDLLPLDYLKKMALQRLDMAFTAEAYCGDTLTLYHVQQDDHTQHVVIQKNNEEEQQPVTVCRIRMGFVPI